MKTNIDESTGRKQDQKVLMFPDCNARETDEASPSIQGEAESPAMNTETPLLDEIEYLAGLLPHDELQACFRAVVETAYGHSLHDLYEIAGAMLPAQPSARAEEWEA